MILDIAGLLKDAPGIISPAYYAVIQSYILTGKAAAAVSVIIVVQTYWYCRTVFGLWQS